MCGGGGSAVIFSFAFPFRPTSAIPVAAKITVSGSTQNSLPSGRSNPLLNYCPSCMGQIGVTCRAHGRAIY